MVVGKAQKCINMSMSMAELDKVQVESSLYADVSFLEATRPHRDVEVYISTVSSPVLWDLLLIFPYLLPFMLNKLMIARGEMGGYG